MRTKSLRRSLLLPALAAISAAVAGPALAVDPAVKGPLAHDPIPGTVTLGSLPACTPFLIPAGFTQTVVVQEEPVCPSAPVLDVYDTAAGGGAIDVADYARWGQIDWPDMSTVNETGRKAGRYLYRTHEVRNLAGFPSGSAGGPDWGSVSVFDLETKQGRVIASRADFEALDGIEWTPWGTLLFAEEAGPTNEKDPALPAAQHGHVYELTPDSRNPMLAAKVELRADLGSLAHEGIAVGPRGEVYVIDEFASGSIYRFVPERTRDLSSGTLSALVIDDAASTCKTGAAHWVPLDMAAARLDARAEADRVGGTGYGRPEDLEIIGNILYAAITSEKRVLAIDIEHAADATTVSNYVLDTTASVAAACGDANVTGLDSPDNLASDRARNLYVNEDFAPGDVWAATRDSNHDGYPDSVTRFLSLSTPGAEPTGVYVSPHDPRTMYVNVQHSCLAVAAACVPNDMTIAIRPTHDSDNERDDH